LAAALSIQALQGLASGPAVKKVAPGTPLHVGSAEVWWAAWASAVGRSASLPLWTGLWDLLSHISKAGPRVPVWVSPLVSLWASSTLDRVLGEKFTPFSPSSYLQVLLLSLILGGGQFLPPAAPASLVLGLPDLTPSDRGAPARAFVRHGAKMLESADPIDAAYSQLNAPETARQQAARMSLLMSPLTGSATTLNSGVSSSLVSSQNEERVTAPLRPSLRLLPHARPRVVHASLDDEDTDAVAATGAPAQPSASLLQRLGSQFW
jgi:hypothetical protein